MRQTRLSSDLLQRNLALKILPVALQQQRCNGSDFPKAFRGRTDAGGYVQGFSLGDPQVGSYISTALKYLGVTISNLAIIMNPDKIYLHCPLFSNEEISEELMDYIKQQLLFVDDPTDQTVDILPYNPLEGAAGAAAYAIKQFYISVI